MKKILTLILTIFIFSGCSLLINNNEINTSYGKYTIQRHIKNTLC